MKFEELIKAALKKRGLDEELWEQIKVTAEDQIDEAVFDLAVERAATSESDKRVTQAVQTLTKKHTEELAALKAESDKLKKEEPKKKSDADKNGGEMNLKMISELVIETMQPLVAQIKELSEKQQDKDTSSLINAALETAGLPKEFAQHIQRGTQEEVTQAVNSLKDVVQREKQIALDKVVGQQKPPPNPFATTQVASAKIDSYLEAKNRRMGGGLLAAQAKETNNTGV